MPVERRLVAAIGDTLTIYPGESGNYVRPYQQALNQWALEQGVPNWAPLAVDGVYGPGTEAAVGVYQVAAQLLNKPEVVKGRLDDLTRDLLERFVE